MTLNPVMAAMLCRKLNVSTPEDLESAQRKMAVLPALARLRNDPDDTSEKAWPILQCENVFVLPGVPQFFSQKMGTICNNFVTGSHMFISKIAVAAEESSLAGRLSEIVDAHSLVAFG